MKYIPQNWNEKTPVVPYDLNDEYRDALNEIIPASAQRPYDMKAVIDLIVDDASFMEVHKEYAENIVVDLED